MTRLIRLSQIMEPPRLTRISLLVLCAVLGGSLSTRLAAQDYPVAMPTDQPGVVLSPFAADRELDVAGMEPGSLAMDPVADKIFRIPYSSPVQQTYEDYLGNPQSGSSGASVQDTPAVSRPEPSAQDRPAIQPSNFGGEVPPHQYPDLGTQLPESVKPSWTPERQVVPENLLLFLFDFNHLSSDNDPAALLSFYADPVGNYFGKARVGHAEIYKDRAAYIRRFPQRSYLIASQPILLSRSGDVYDLMLRVDYAVSGSGKNLSGSVTHSIQVQEQAGQYRIIGIQESKAKRPPQEVVQQDDQRRQTQLQVPQEEQGVYDRFQQEQLERFLEAFTASGEVNDPTAGIAFMHPQMDVYYSLRNPSRRDLLNDRSRYIQRWPERRYWLTERPQIRRLSDGSWEAVSKVGYEVRNQSKYLNGVATSIVRMAYTSEGLKIISIREQ